MADTETAQTEEQSQDKQAADETASEKDGSSTARKQKQFFKEELKRLEISLKEEQSKIEEPPHKEHVPFLFNNLDPYFNTAPAKFLIKLDEEEEADPEKPMSSKRDISIPGYVSRKTALDICDPWVDHNMDVNPEDLHDSSMKIVSPRDGPAKKDQDRPPKEGSTRLPKFPAVHMSKKGIKNELNYADVPGLREQLKEKLGAGNAEQKSEDYTRTKQDFFRMELDKMDEIHPINRDNMKATYFAYLQNTPGSKKAIHECLK